jgi:peptidoglycan hydrolase CwlO-like protein
MWEGAQMGAEAMYKIVTNPTNIEWARQGKRVYDLIADLSDARKRIAEYQAFSKRAEREIKDLNASVADLQREREELRGKIKEQGDWINSHL